MDYQSSDSSWQSDTDTESITSTCTSSDDFNNSDGTSKQTTTNAEDKNLSLLACFLRNKLNASACRDLIGTLKSAFPNSQEIAELDYSSLLSKIETSAVYEVHYCTQCLETFPNDINIFQCQSPNCSGLRYKGPLATQEKMK